jgi:hypothetical protein
MGWVDAAIKHDALALVPEDEARTAHLLARSKRSDSDMIYHVITFNVVCLLNGLLHCALHSTP